MNLYLFLFILIQNNYTYLDIIHLHLKIQGHKPWIPIMDIIINKSSILLYFSKVKPFKILVVFLDKHTLS